jgi:multidrug resistance efflux pump
VKKKKGAFMTNVLQTPRRRGHLRLFLISLAILVAGLAVFLFAVQMEATTTATGTVIARDMTELRAPVPGLVEMERSEKNRRNKIEPGDEVSGGQTLAVVKPSEWWRGGPTIIKAPETDSLWLVAAVDVSHGEGVTAGQRLLTLVPLEPQTRRPRELLARLSISEEHAIEVQPGQQLRVTSNLYNERIHGKFSAVVERIEPMAVVGEDGKRRYTILAVLDDPPGPLLLGSSVKAEIILGRKRVYRIILEH